jgi:hypothetical protein
MNFATDCRRQRARRTLAGWVIAFVGLEVAFGAALQGPLDFVRNSRYAARIRLLEAHCHADDERPLVLVLGTSRAQYGLRPDMLDRVSAQEPRSPIVFNFSSPGYGPTHHYVTLKRLLREGYRPTGIVLELAPHQLAADVSHDDYINFLHLSYADLNESLPFRERPDEVRREWLRAQVSLPCFTYRHYIMSTFLPGWTPADQNTAGFDTLDSYGWNWFDRTRTSRPSPEMIRARFGPMLGELRIAPVNELAVERIVAVCRAEQIALVVLFMPEGPVLRSCYSAQSLNALHDFQSRLRSHPGVSVVDAGGWLNSENDFADSEHILHTSAAAFTRRFSQEAMPLFRSLAAHRVVVNNK